MSYKWIGFFLGVKHINFENCKFTLIHRHVFRRCQNFSRCIMKYLLFEITYIILFYDYTSLYKLIRMLLRIKWLISYFRTADLKQWFCLFSIAYAGHPISVVRWFYYSRSNSPDEKTNLCHFLRYLTLFSLGEKFLHILMREWTSIFWKSSMVLKLASIRCHYDIRII